MDIKPFFSFLTKNRDTTKKLHPGFLSRRTLFSGLFQLAESDSPSKDDSQILSFNKKGKPVSRVLYP